MVQYRCLWWSDGTGVYGRVRDFKAILPCRQDETCRICHVEHCSGVGMKGFPWIPRKFLRNDANLAMLQICTSRGKKNLSASDFYQIAFPWQRNVQHHLIVSDTYLLIELDWHLYHRAGWNGDGKNFYGVGERDETWCRRVGREMRLRGGRVGMGAILCVHVGPTCSCGLS